MKGVSKFLSNPRILFPHLGARGFFHGVDDETYLKKCFKAYMGYELDLENPRTFNEKLQWLKLNDRNPLYTTLVDKAEVKPWVAERIGWEHVVPTFGVWDSFDDIDFGNLPDRFVLKCTHDSGGLVICRDRATFDYGAAKKKIDSSLARNFFWSGREWPYKDVRPRILAEQYLDPAESGDLADYKLFRFTDGRKVTLVCEDRELGAGMSETFFTDSWEALTISESGHPTNPGHPEPEHFAEMKALCDQLAEGLPFCRVDFYESSRGLLFGEMTLYPNAGFERFDPASVDAEWGEWIELPQRVGGGVLVMSDDRLVWIRPASISESRDSGQAVQGMTDYKFYCFDGEPGFLYVSQGLEDHETARISFLSLDWDFMPFRRGDYRPFEELPPKPSHLDEMVDIARELSRGVPFVRVDLFEYGGGVLFSEMTFHPCSGFMPISPGSADEKMGARLCLPA